MNKLSVGQAAHRLGISKSWLDKKRVQGGGPTYIKLGRRVLYDENDLDAWADTHRRSHTSQ
ncbi:helix-turn-helix domain-containing protein [Methylobacterium sp. E-016]|uniref:helix-turn-helix transcriptional regulator n=1 Tax=Methylobacterium sp. E-016 TaxID=2836556 RepID=UPI001FB8D702|nr:helix-turn-helix domain-containing protein [Methylobacterium sp. E-016]MCJ2077618.1 helix-turn-helix domain-containing protein [Methylobacterium sp. E-016]